MGRWDVAMHWCSVEGVSHTEVVQAHAGTACAATYRA